MSKVKRADPDTVSMPIVEMRSPVTIMIRALGMDFPARPVMAASPRTTSEKYSGGPKRSATSASGLAMMISMRRANMPATKEPMAEMARAGPGAALAGHLVAVEAGYDRGRFARRVDQDGGGGTAVHRPVEDAGQHDDGAHRPLLRGQGARDRRGDGNQERHPAGRADARQHAHERADENAEEAEQDVVPAQGFSETQGQEVQSIHRADLFS